MKKIRKFYPIIFSLALTLVIWGIYFGGKYFILQKQGLQWRPYVTRFMIIVSVLAQLFFFAAIIYQLIKHLKAKTLLMKLAYSAGIFALVVVAFHIFILGWFFSDLAHEHETVIKEENRTYISCLSDWSPSTYHYYEYHGWFTMAAEEFDSKPVEWIAED